MSSDTKLIPRRLGKIEIAAKLSQLIENTIKDVTPHNMLFQSCIVCEHFGENEICAKYNVRPPARIIVFGCQNYEESSHIDDDIPF